MNFQQIKMTNSSDEEQDQNDNRYIDHSYQDFIRNYYVPEEQETDDEEPSIWQQTTLTQFFPRQNLQHVEKPNANKIAIKKKTTDTLQIDNYFPSTKRGKCIYTNLTLKIEYIYLFQPK